MAKLYWRVKVANKWTWKVATDDNTIIIAPTVVAIVMTHDAVETFKNLNGIQEEE